MTRDPLVELGLTFAGLSLIAVGGANAVVPEIERQVVGMRGWMSGSEFATLFAIAQAAPGPNVLVVSLIGWRVAGLGGLLVATAAMCGPPALLAFAASRLSGRFRRSALVQAARAGLAPLAVGLLMASGLVMARAAAGGWNPLLLAVTAGAALFIAGTGRNPLWALGVGGLVGLLGLHLP